MTPLPQEPPLRPEEELWRALRQDGLFTFGVLAVALCITTLGVTIEAFLLPLMRNHTSPCLAELLIVIPGSDDSKWVTGAIM